MEENQRRHPRLSFAVDVELQTETRTICGSTRDISTTGLYMETSEELAADTHCQVAITLNSGHAESIIRAQGKVVRLTHLPTGSGPGIGIHFEDLDPQSQSLLWRVIQYNSTGDETSEENEGKA